MIDQKTFERKRLINWLLAGLAYACFYFGRYNFSSAHAIMAQNFNWKYTDYGIIVSGALIVYGLSVFLNGPLADKIGGKKSLLIGSIGAGIFNIIFGLIGYFANKDIIMTSSKLIGWLAIIWAINHYFQSFGALSVVKINSAWFQLHERGKQAGKFGITIQIGRFLVFNFCPIIILYLIWPMTFIIPGICLLLMSIFIYKYIYDKPEDIDYQLFDTPTKNNEEVKVRLILKKIFINPLMWLIAFCSMFIGVTRNAIDHWFARYMIDEFHIAKNALITFGPYKLITVLMPFLMILSGFISGYLSDKYFESRRGPIVLFSFIGQLISLLALTYFIHDPWLAAICLCFILFFIQGGHVIINAVSSQDWGGRKAAATATGFFDGIQYLAGSIVGYILGNILQKHKGEFNQWQYWATFPIITCFFGIILSGYLWNKKPEKGEH